MQEGSRPDLLEVEVVRARRGSGVISAADTSLTLRATAADDDVARRLADLSRGRPVEMAVRITGDRELRELNARFLDQDHPTDVLSFFDGEGNPMHLGDLALSWPAIQRQARQFGHSPQAEAALLLVHGLLHLVGFDHARPEDEVEMTRATLRCLRSLGISLAGGRL